MYLVTFPCWVPYCLILQFILFYVILHQQRSDLIGSFQSLVLVFRGLDVKSAL